MKKNILMIFTYFTIYLLSGCENKEDYLPLKKDFNYPLQIGNSWIYNLKAGDNNYEHKWDVIKEDTLNDRNIFIIQRSIYENGKYTPKFKDYYFNDYDGWYLAATTDTVYIGIPDLKTLKLVNQEDSLIVFHSPIKLLHYPLIIGEKWSSRSNFKKYVKKQIINSNIGRVECIVLEDNALGFDNVPHIKQYFSTKGLVKEISYIYITDGKGNIVSVDSTSIKFELVNINF